MSSPNIPQTVKPMMHILVKAKATPPDFGVDTGTRFTRQTSHPNAVASALRSFWPRFRATDGGRGPWSRYEPMTEPFGGEKTCQSAERA